MSFEIGENVEVIDNEDGMDGSYFAGKVIDRSLGRRRIKYDTLIADDGSCLEEVINIRRLCPPPPTVFARFHLGYMVDAWHNEGWWVGRVEGIRDGRKVEGYQEIECPGLFAVLMLFYVFPFSVIVSF
ncbi:hypothetical protein LXL04_016347 [Taraxacum kok-saghyz]